MITASEYINEIIIQDIEEGEVPVSIHLSPNLYTEFQGLCGDYVYTTVLWDDQFEVEVLIDGETENTASLSTMPILEINWEPQLRLV